MICLNAVCCACPRRNILSIIILFAQPAYQFDIRLCISVFYILQDSDCDDKSLSQADSLDGMSDIICGENFNTLKKGPNWTEFTEAKTASPIAPPPEFRDGPSLNTLEVFEDYARDLAVVLLSEALVQVKKHNSTFFKPCTPAPFYHKPVLPIISKAAYWSPDFLPFSPCHGSNRPSSRSSLGSSRLSSSHNSLSVPTARRADDSSFITQVKFNISI